MKDATYRVGDLVRRVGDPLQHTYRVTFLGERVEYDRRGHLHGADYVVTVIPVKGSHALPSARPQSYRPAAEPWDTADRTRHSALMRGRAASRKRERDHADAEAERKYRTADAAINHRLIPVWIYMARGEHAERGRYHESRFRALAIRNHVDPDWLMRVLDAAVKEV